MNDVTTSRTQSTGAPPRDMTLEEFLGVPQPSQWRRWRNWIIAGAVLLVAVLLLWRYLGGQEAAAYATQPVRRGDLTVTVSATGNLQPTNKVDVGSEQSGLVTDVFVDNNDRVTRGRPLARLDTSRLRDQITQNQAAVASAQAQVAQAQASAVQARANLNRLEEVYRLSGGKVPSRTELDSGRAESQRAVASVRAAEAQVASARANLNSSLTNLSKATIYSPVNGVILQRQIDPGQTVAASFQAPVLFSIAEDLSKMKLEVKVDEADIGQVREGQRATFTVDAYPGQTFPAVISRIDVGSSAAATGSTSTANTVVSYTAELAVENPELMLRPGMTATADIVTMEKRDVILVPNAALRFNPNAPVETGQQQGVGMPGTMPMGGFRRPRGERQVRIGRGSIQTVYIVGSDGEPQPLRVRVGDTNGALTEVIGEGLKPGQKVITGRLAPGTEQNADQGDRPGGQRIRQEGQGQGRQGQQVGEKAQGDRPNDQTPRTERAANALQPPGESSEAQARPQAVAAAGARRPEGAGKGRSEAFRNASPEQRQRMREARQNASPEEREQMRERFMARRAQREGAEAQASTGE